MFSKWESLEDFFLYVACLHPCLLHHSSFLRCLSFILYHLPSSKTVPSVSIFPVSAFPEPGFQACCYRAHLFVRLLGIPTQAFMFVSPFHGPALFVPVLVPLSPLWARLPLDKRASSSHPFAVSTFSSPSILLPRGLSWLRRLETIFKLILFLPELTNPRTDAFSVHITSLKLLLTACLFSISNEQIQQKEMGCLLLLLTSFPRLSVWDKSTTLFPKLVLRKPHTVCFKCSYPQTT